MTQRLRAGPFRRQPHFIHRENVKSRTRVCTSRLAPPEYHPCMAGWAASWRGISGCVVAGFCLALLPAGALTPAKAQEAVDVELVLAVDVSLSMSPDELSIQRDGYVAALTHEDVINAIEDGLHGKIAITYFEWAGDSSQHIVVPWTTIASAEDAERVASRLTAQPPGSARRTSISGAIKFARDLFAESGYKGARRVLDISGDGPNNQGSRVDVARDELISKGVTINGLPLMTNGGAASSFSIEDLDTYYAQCVIGGPGAFMVPVNDWTQFPEAIRRKLVIELAGEQPSDFPVIEAASEGKYDCLIGEKMWDDRFWMWNDP